MMNFTSTAGAIATISNASGLYSIAPHIKSFAAGADKLNDLQEAGTALMSGKKAPETSAVDYILLPLTGELFKNAEGWEQKLLVSIRDFVPTIMKMAKVGVKQLPVVSQVIGFMQILEAGVEIYRGDTTEGLLKAVSGAAFMAGPLGAVGGLLIDKFAKGGATYNTFVKAKAFSHFGKWAAKGKCANSLAAQTVLKQASNADELTTVLSKASNLKGIAGVGDDIKGVHNVLSHRFAGYQSAIKHSLKRSATKGSTLINNGAGKAGTAYGTMKSKIVGPAWSKFTEAKNTVLNTTVNEAQHIKNTAENFKAASKSSAVQINIVS